MRMLPCFCKLLRPAEPQDGPELKCPSSQVSVTWAHAHAFRNCHAVSQLYLSRCTNCMSGLLPSVTTGTQLPVALPMLEISLHQTVCIKYLSYAEPPLGAAGDPRGTNRKASAERQGAAGATMHTSRAARQG